MGSQSVFGAVVYDKTALTNLDPLSYYEIADPLGGKDTTPRDFRNNGTGRPFVSDDRPSNPTPVNANRGGVVVSSISGIWPIAAIFFGALFILRK